MLPALFAVGRAVLPSALRAAAGLFGRTAVQTSAQATARAAGAFRSNLLSASRNASRGAIRSSSARGGGSLLGRAAVTYTAFDVLGDILGSFFSGAGSGITGGVLGGEGGRRAGTAGSAAGSSSLSSSFSPFGGTGGNFSGENKENCCCCRETLALLGSIDNTLKANLRVSTAQVQLEASRNAAERERLAETSRQNVPGMGGARETAKDVAEQTGYNIGQFILQAVAALGFGNAGQTTQQNAGTQKSFNPGTYKEEPQKKASGGLILGPGGPREDLVSARLAGGGRVNLSNGEYVINAESTRANLSLLQKINSNPFSMAAQEEKKAIKQGAIIGNIVAETLEKTFKKQNLFGKEDRKQIVYVTQKSPSPTLDTKTSGGTSVGDMFSSMLSSMTGRDNNLTDLIAKSESRGDPNIYRKGGQAVAGQDLQKLTIDEVIALGGTAYGKYQFTPETLMMLSRDLKLDTAKIKFTEAVQDKLANHQIMKIKSVQAAIRDPSEKNINAAMTDISFVWRGLPDPRSGTTYQDQYAKFNKSNVPIGEFRDEFMAFLQNKKASPLQNIMATLKRTGQFLEQTALSKEMAANKQMQAAATPTVVVNNQGGQRQSSSPMTAILDTTGPRLPLLASQFTPISTFIL